MTLRARIGAARPRVVVAGAGVAGLEALLALRELAGERLDLELISPQRSFFYRPMEVAAAFGTTPATAIDVAALAAGIDAEYVEGALIGADEELRRITLATGEKRPFDALIVATGAVPEDVIPGAVPFGMAGARERFTRILAAMRDERLHRVAFAVPPRAGWPIAVYELALMTARRLAEADVHPELSLVTPELVPLELFGGRASAAVRELLELHEIEFRAGLGATEVAWGELRAEPGHERLPVDVVIAMAVQRGPFLRGLPRDPRGFLPVDRHGLVRGCSRVYAAGDVISFPIKQGGLAAQQAQAAAEAVAAEAGAPVTPGLFEPVLRGMLMTGERPLYLEAPVREHGGSAGRSSFDPLWWPPAKLAGRHLAPFLAQIDPAVGPPAGLEVVVPVGCATS